MPVNLKDGNLIQALSIFCKENSGARMQVDFFTNADADSQLSSDLKRVLYRVTQELVHNALKYAQSERCHVQLMQSENTIQLSVEDEGVGMKVSEQVNSQGLKSIQDRITAFGGDFSIESRPGKGTLAMIHIPLKA